MTVPSSTSHHSYPCRDGTKGTDTMTTQHHLAREIVAGRAHRGQDPALLLTVELARQAERSDRRAARRARRRG